MEAETDCGRRKQHRGTLTAGTGSEGQRLTSSSSSAFSGRRLRGEGKDSFCKTATSRREIVPR